MASTAGRTIDDLTDDEILDAIAKCGIDGLHEGRLPEVLGVAGDWDTIKSQWPWRRIKIRGGRIEHFLDRVGLSKYEWSRRLANKSADEVLALLNGRK